MGKRQEIVKMMDGWMNETNGRSALTIMQDEHDKIRLHHTGRRIDIITALASVITQEKEIYDEVVAAMIFANKKAGLSERLKLAWTFLTVRI